LQPFVDIRSGKPVNERSRFAVAWDAEHLYAIFEFVDAHREATATEPGTHVYRYDTTAELFVGGPRGYYEIGLNSIGVSYQVAWWWVEPLVRSSDMQAIDRLFRLPNFLYYLPRRGEVMGRVGDLDFALEGLEQRVAWSDLGGDPGWTARLALPWASLGPLLGFDAATVASGMDLRVQGMRANPARSGRSPSTWTWSVQGNDDVHNPERWGRVTLVDSFI